MTGKNMSWLNFRITFIVYGWKIVIEIKNAIIISKKCPVVRFYNISFYYMIIPHYINHNMLPKLIHDIFLKTDLSTCQ